MGRGAALRQRRGGGRFLAGEPAGPAPDGGGGGGERRGVGVRDDYVANRPANAGADQAAGPAAVFELSEHDEAVVKRTNGTGTERTMKTLKQMRSAECGVRNETSADRLGVSQISHS